MRRHLWGHLRRQMWRQMFPISWRWGSNIEDIHSLLMFFSYYDDIQCNLMLFDVVWSYSMF